MDIKKQTEFLSYLESQAALCRAGSGALSADGRYDEAVFAKVRLNVYDIFRTVFSAAVNTAGEDAAAFFREKLQQIPANWVTALAAAEQHGHSEKAHIERLKLEIAGAVRAKFQELWGDAE